MTQKQIIVFLVLFVKFITRVGRFVLTSTKNFTVVPVPLIVIAIKNIAKTIHLLENLGEAVGVLCI